MFKTMPSMTLEQGLAGAIKLQQAGRADEAENLLHQILAQHPDCADALHLLGVLCTRGGRNAEAVELLRKAVELQPRIASFQVNLANVLLVTGRVGEAIQGYRAALAIRPDFPEATSGLADALRLTGQIDEAVEQYQKAIAMRPGVAELYINLALALEIRGRYEYALAAIDNALKIRPDWSLAWNNRAKTLRDQGRLEEAATSARRALAITPDLAEAHINLAGCLMDSGDIDGAIVSIRRGLELAPGNPTAHNLAANIWKEAGTVNDSIAELDRALKLNPDDAAFHSNKVYLLEFDPRSDGQSLLSEQRRWNARHALDKRIHPHENDRNPDRRLRIGYISPYFHAHAESFFVVPLLESHDHKQFEIYCYSDTNHSDGVTERIRRAANIWRPTNGASHEELARTIRGDRIDVLVDLTMHMAFNRAVALAQKPAPVQVAWLAYPGGTGLDAMDYRITDPWIDPPGMDESCYQEKSIRLPRTWICFDPLGDDPPPPPRAPGPICFGSLNNPCKLNEPVLELWARVLNAVPDSRMLLQTLSEFQRKRITELFQASGIHPNRIEFVPRCSRGEYRKLYHRIDIGLDPLPYNGITTTCDALWMGVPVISMAGQIAAGRAGASILNNIGLGELATTTSEDFVKSAASLASDMDRLTELRRTLRDRLRGSPLMDGPAFARNMETAYRRMWATWCNAKV